MTDEFLAKDVTHQDKAILMCIERIDNLEAQVCSLNNRYRQTLLNTICACDCAREIALDVFFFLLGVKPEERWSTVDVIRNIIPKYMGNVLQNHRIMEMSRIVISPTPFYQISEHDLVHYPCLDQWGIRDTVSGYKILEFLKTWTLEELEEYLSYRQKWSFFVK